MVIRHLLSWISRVHGTPVGLRHLATIGSRIHPILVTKQQRIFRTRHRISACIAAISFSLMFLAQPIKSDSLRKPVSQTADSQSLLCRVGTNLVPNPVTPPIAAFDLRALRIGWYTDYGASDLPAHPSGIEYMPMIHLTQTGPNDYSATPSGALLESVIAANPGADWFIGNEPDRRFFQDDIEPHVYARAYHDLYKLIKTADPVARIFAGSIVQPTPLRLQYLDLILTSYFEQFGAAMPVDGWSIHNFILNEASCSAYNDLSICWGADIPPGIDVSDGLRISIDEHDRFDLFVDQIIRFREWMVRRGYRGKPVYLSEFGVLMPARFGFPPSRVNSFMNNAFDYLLDAKDPTLGDPTDGYHLIQRFSWYSTSDSTYNGYLFERQGEADAYNLSAMGLNFTAYTASLPETSDFYPLSIQADPPAPLTSGGNVTFTLQTQVANSGNGLTPSKIDVRFYVGDPAYGGLPIDGNQTAALGGCGDNTLVQVTWRDVPAGEYQIFVVVDEKNHIAETNEENNVRTQTLVFANHQLFLPYIQHAMFTQQVAD
jgi:hypothetical protein